MRRLNKPKEHPYLGELLRNPLSPHTHREVLGLSRLEPRQPTIQSANFLGVSQKGSRERCLLFFFFFSENEMEKTEENGKKTEENGKKRKKTEENGKNQKRHRSGDPFCETPIFRREFLETFFGSAIILVLRGLAAILFMSRGGILMKEEN